MAIRLDHGADELTEVHDINVTPFIDVMLVLLIIFMVAAPLATVDVPVDLPSSNTAPQQRPDKPIFLTVKADLTPCLGDDPVTPAACPPRSMPPPDRTKTSASSCAPTAPCPMATSCRCMNDLRGAGYLKIALVGLENRGIRHEHARAAMVRRPRSRATWCGGAFAAAVVVLVCVAAIVGYMFWHVPRDRNRRRRAAHIGRTDGTGDRSAGAGQGRYTAAAAGDLVRRHAAGGEAARESRADQPGAAYDSASRGQRAANRSVLAEPAAQTPPAVQELSERRAGARRTRRRTARVHASNRDGHVLSRHIVTGSGYAELDAEVLALVSARSRCLHFPPSMTEANSISRCRSAFHCADGARIPPSQAPRTL